MYAIYNNDGSVKLTNLNEIITQGSTTTTIFIAVIDYENTDYTAIARYVLPNKTSSAGNGVATNQEINGITYKGWLFTLTQDETYYYGELLMSVEISLGTTILFTFPIYLTINKSGFVADTTQMTITQYSNIISSLDTIFAQFSSYVSLANDETITGDKTFDGEVRLNNNFVFNLGGGEIIGYVDEDTHYTYELPTENGTFALEETSTCLFQHTITLVAQLGSVSGVVVNLFIVSNHANAINNETKLKNAIQYAVSVRGYFLNEDISSGDYCRILEAYVYSDTIYLVYNPSSLADDYIHKAVITSVATVVDENDKL